MRGMCCPGRRASRLLLDHPFPGGDSGADFVNDPGNFVAWNAWILQTRPPAILGIEIAATNAAGSHLDADLAWSRRRISRSTISKSPFGFRNLRHFHPGHCGISRQRMCPLDAKRNPVESHPSGVALCGKQSRRHGLRSHGKDSYTGGPAL